MAKPNGSFRKFELLATSAYLQTHTWDDFNSWNPVSEAMREKLKFVVALNNKIRIANSMGVLTIS